MASFSASPSPLGVCACLCLSLCLSEFPVCLSLGASPGLSMTVSLVRVSGLCLCLSRSPCVLLSLSPSLCLSVHSVSVSPAVSGAFSVPACLVWPEFLPVPLPFSRRRCLPEFRCLWDRLVWPPQHPCLHTLSPLLSVTEPQEDAPGAPLGPTPHSPEAESRCASWARGYAWPTGCAGRRHGARPDLLPLERGL